MTYAESVPGMTGWVVVSVDRHGEGEPAVASAPGFLQAYLRTARITDGGVHVEDGPVVLDEDDVQRFVHTMTEPRRRVPIVVVSVDLQNPGAGRVHADYLAGALAGASLVVQLADLRAQDRFNKAMGEELGVFGGGIRTYLAPFGPAEERYPYRHRPMGVAIIRDQGIAALNRVVDGVIGGTARRELPDDVQQTLGIVYRVLAGRAEVERDRHGRRTPAREDRSHPRGAAATDGGHEPAPGAVRHRGRHREAGSHEGRPSAKGRGGSANGTITAKANRLPRTKPSPSRRGGYRERKTPVRLPRTVPSPGDRAAAVNGAVAEEPRPLPRPAPPPRNPSQVPARGPSR